MDVVKIHGSDKLRQKLFEGVKRICVFIEDVLRQYPVKDRKIRRWHT